MLCDGQKRVQRKQSRDVLFLRFLLLFFFEWARHFDDSKLMTGQKKKTHRVRGEFGFDFY